MSSRTQVLGGKRVFISHVTLKEVCDPKDVKTLPLRHIRDQIFLPRLVLQLHLLYCQGVCVAGDLNLWDEKNQFLFRGRKDFTLC